MNILDGSWLSFNKNSLFHEVLDNSLVRIGQNVMTSLDRSANGHLDPIFFNQFKPEQSLNQSYKFLNKSQNIIDDDSKLNTSIRSSKQFVSGFQPYQPTPQETQLNQITRIPIMCIDTKVLESESEEQTQKSQKSEYLLPSFKINYDLSAEADQRRKKNQTKNIPKNYGKAIIGFMQKNKSKILQIFGFDCTQAELTNQLKSRKRSINTIRDIRDLWMKSKFSKQFRIISNLFLRKYAFEYIFNSRITNYSSHIKYKHKLREAVESPNSFICIKDKDY